MKIGGHVVVFLLVHASRYVLSCYIATASHCAATAPPRKWSMLHLETRCGETIVRVFASI